MGRKSFRPRPGPVRDNARWFLRSRVFPTRIWISCAVLDIDGCPFHKMIHFFIQNHIEIDGVESISPTDAVLG